MSDTLRNIKETKSCVVQLISSWFLEAANHTCGSYDYEVDEMTVANLDTLPSFKVPAPRVAQSPLHAECVLERCIEVKNNTDNTTSTISVLKVVMAHVNKSVYDEKKGVCNVRKLSAMSRLGGDTYGETVRAFNGKEGVVRDAVLTHDFLSSTSPNPSYLCGQKQTPAFSMGAADFVSFDQIDEQLVGNFGPRPVIVVTSKSCSGAPCTSMHSLCNVVGSDPPTFLLSIQSTANERSSTLENILSNGKCALHGCSKTLFEKARRHFPSVNTGRDEMKLIGEEETFHFLPGFVLDVDRIAESPVQIECKLIDTHEMAGRGGTVSSTMLVLQACMFHVDRSICNEDDGVVHADLFEPISRLNGDELYGLTGKTFDLARPNKDRTPGKLRFRNSNNRSIF